MSEHIPNIKTPENFEMAEIEEAHHQVVEILKREIVSLHTKKLYHGPDHTLGNSEDELPTGVVNALKLISNTFKNSFSKTLESRPSIESKFKITELGMEAGMLAHDIILNIKGIKPDGTLERSRGWQPGGNEYESYLHIMNLFYESGLDDNNPYYHTYVQTIKRTIAGTDPDAMNFASPVSEEQIGQFSPAVRECVTNKDTGKVSVLRIDSNKAGDAMESLFGSTADLSASAVPDISFRTGNLEFWEWQVEVSRSAAEFLDGNNMPDRKRAVEMLHAMKSWRKIQVGVILGQIVRFSENYTPENIRDLFENKFGVTPGDEEIDSFLTMMRIFTAGSQISIEESANKYNEFSDSFVIEATGDEGLNTQERETLSSAIAFMGGKQAKLKDYVEHVDEELAKISDRG